MTNMHHQLLPPEYVWMDMANAHWQKNCENPAEKYSQTFMHNVPRSDDNEDKCPAPHFLGCPFLTRPLRAATVMSSC